MFLLSMQAANWSTANIHSSNTNATFPTEKYWSNPFPKSISDGFSWKKRVMIRSRALSALCWRCSYTLLGLYFSVVLFRFRGKQNHNLYGTFDWEFSPWAGLHGPIWVICVATFTLILWLDLRKSYLVFLLLFQ